MIWASVQYNHNLQFFIERAYLRTNVSSSTGSINININENFDMVVKSSPSWLHVISYLSAFTGASYRLFLRGCRGIPGSTWLLGCTT